MDQFPSNSKRSRVENEPKKVEQITTAAPDRRRRGVGRKFKEAFIGGDAKSAMQYMILEVVIPSIQDTMVDAFQGGVERLIKGEGPRHRRSPRGGGYGYDDVPRIDYSGISRGPAGQKSSQQRTMLSRQARARHDFDELIIPNRREAEEVLSQMFDILSQWGAVSVADLYSLTGIQSNHTDAKWGWEELRGARVDRRSRGGFLLDLPEPEELGR